MPKISSYPDGGIIQAADQFVIARGGNNYSILGNKIVNRTAFTPVVEGTTIAGLGTYTTQLGDYCRIANLLFFEIYLTWTAHTGTGNMRVAGLPIAAVNNAMYALPSVGWNNITLLAAGNKIQAYVNPGTSNISLFEIGSGALALLPIDTAATLFLSGFYFVA